MKFAILLAGCLLLAGVWHLRASPAQSAASETQQIRIDPVDNSRGRLRVSGREDWIVAALTFDVIPEMASPASARTARPFVRPAGSASPISSKWC